MLDLDKRSITYLPGVGPKKADILQKEAGISSYEDLLFYFPYKYIDRSRFYKVVEISGNMPYIQLKGEILSFETLGEGNDRIQIRPMGDGFVFHNKDKESEEEFRRKAALAKEAWQMVEKEVMSDAWDLIVLDEINYAIHFGMISAGEVAELIQKRPERLNMILTGRYAEQQLIDLADTVTEMTLVKHAFQKGIRARKGIEF